MGTDRTRMMEVLGLVGKNWLGVGVLPGTARPT